MSRGRYGFFSGSPADELRAGRTAASAPSLLFLGLCPAIAVSARVVDALWISAGLILVLVLSNFAMSLLARDSGADGETGMQHALRDSATDGADGADGADRASTANRAERPAAPAALLRALLITSFLTASFEAVLLARAPSASASLGIYAPLIAVNCLVLGGGSAGAPGLALWASVLRSLGRGVRFALALVLIALVREVLGAGTITLFPMAAFGGTIALRGLVDEPVRALGLAGGALLCLGYLAGAARAITARAARARPAGTGAQVRRAAGALGETSR